MATRTYTYQPEKKKKKLLYADILFSLCLFLEGGVLLQVYFNESVSGT